MHRSPRKLRSVTCYLFAAMLLATACRSDHKDSTGVILRLESDATFDASLRLRIQEQTQGQGCGIPELKTDHSFSDDALHVDVDGYNDPPNQICPLAGAIETVISLPDDWLDSPGPKRITVTVADVDNTFEITRTGHVFALTELTTQNATGENEVIDYPDDVAVLALRGPLDPDVDYTTALTEFSRDSGYALASDTYPELPELPEPLEGLLVTIDEGLLTATNPSLDLGDLPGHPGTQAVLYLPS